MLPARRIVTLALLASGGLTSIASVLAPLGSPPEQHDEAPPECEVPRDCGAGFACLPDESSRMVCVQLSCLEDADCNLTAGERCFRHTGLCAPPTCETEWAPACDDDERCLMEGASSSCRALRELPLATSCEITPRRVVLQSGAELKLRGAIYDAEGAPVPFPILRYEAPAIPGVTVTADGLIVTTEELTEQTFTIVAHDRSGVSCEVEVVTLPPVADGDVRLVAVDATTGAAVENAVAVFHMKDALGEVRRVEMEERAPGQHIAPLPNVNQLIDASVFAAGYDYATLIRPPTREMVVALQPAQPADQVSGLSGEIDFGEVPSTGDIQVGFASLSRPSPADGVGLYELVASRTEVVNVDLEGVGTFEDVPFGSAIWHRIGNQGIHDYVVPLGAAGTRHLSALGMMSRLSDIGSMIAHANLVYPISFFRPGVSFAVALSGPWNLEDISPDPASPMWEWELPSFVARPSAWSLRTLRFRVTAMPQSSFRDLDPTAVVVLIGAQIPGRGLVLLGAGHAPDTVDDYTDPSDGLVESQPVERLPAELQPQPGEVMLHAVPRQSGLEGYPLRALIVSANDLLYAQQPVAESVVWVDLDELPAADQPLQVDPFLPFAQDHYQRSSRSLSLAQTAEAHLVRSVFHCIERRWTVLLPPEDHTFGLPEPPEGFADCAESSTVESIRLSRDLSYLEVARQAMGAGVWYDRSVERISRQPGSMAP